MHKYVRPRRKCPYCGKAVGRYRKPKTTQTSKQTYWGGWACEKCGKQVKVTFWGRPKK